VELNTRLKATCSVPRVLFGFSPIGLGHATRALVLSGELKRRGADVRLFSGGKAAEFVNAQGVTVDSIVDDPVPRVVRGEMSRVALWYIRSWLANKRTIPRARRLFDSYRPDIVVCDEEFSGVLVAEERGCKRVFISDELLLGFARTWIARKIEQRVEAWYRRLQESVNLLIVPEFGQDGGNRKFVGPIVRVPTRSCDETRKEYGLPAGRMILFAMSGSGIGRELALTLRDALRGTDITASLVITGNRDAEISGEGVYDLGVVPDNQNLVACADLVVSTAGKSTIDEASASGTPIIVIPIRHHAEQERNARALGFSTSDAGRLRELISSRIGRREPPKTFAGEIEASKAILSLLRDS
jgi:UDP-N-acetylglucosamine--N-acetylmuramyl-(pentapeptide) pyrophosphoryl-undecaprenol N-acetylglucosamine transferase